MREYPETGLYSPLHKGIKRCEERKTRYLGVGLINRESGQNQRLINWPNSKMSKQAVLSCTFLNI